MKNDRTKTIFYLDLKHVHRYGCAKFQPNPLFSSHKWPPKVWRKKKNPTRWKKKTKTKKSRQPLKGIPSADGMPQSPEPTPESPCEEQGRGGTGGDTCTEDPETNPPAGDSLARREGRGGVLKTPRPWCSAWWQTGLL